ncbi:50S ribosomal protein L13 [Candidatus Woesebacteria bacterium]|nr:50S ribosomal protein L13 [Candidatus Woesebacteria bacterium]MCD8507617.1 50S ribosomal protein L13 [Candidatus Woesebacteria bacterium]MCD8526796.1 50S ribosomal protein L13 [Candidatus Woesebacteria bacterium]MCD8546457.1 50S ribosomal protein L13 [Candidatus Woesebacteria bacterium]
MQKTFMQRPQDVQREWHLVDAKGRVLGEVAAEAATLLIGKNKPTFTPHVDGGDYVIVINASEVAVTGNKEQDKMYYRHSGRPGGLKQENFATLLDRDPQQVIERAVKGMLPKNKQQTPRLRRLKVFAGAEHAYEDKLKQAK